MFALAKLIHDRTRNGVELVERVLKIARGEDESLDDPRSRTWALDWLSDRGFGKPQQVVELTEGSTAALPDIDLAGLSLQELRQLASESEDEQPAGDSTH